eukprot:TRINITY_DN66299_c0_g1_i1.p1 TRINITY_DN66299_c0_g1~~TRINITY_DN66299_c0_g1_i1.p1  ORF type:complete len:164 (-),score=19.07 TRINITY_DN66299_c0_g1_i1:102-593(-)
MKLGISLDGFGLAIDNEFDIDDMQQFPLELLDAIGTVYSKSLRFFENQGDGDVPPEFLSQFDAFHRMKRAAVAMHRQAPPSLKRVRFHDSVTKAFFVGDLRFTQISPIRRARGAVSYATAWLIANSRSSARTKSYKGGQMQGRKISPSPDGSSPELSSVVPCC